MQNNYKTGSKEDILELIHFDLDLKAQNAIKGCNTSFVNSNNTSCLQSFIDYQVKSNAYAVNQSSDDLQQVVDFKNENQSDQSIINQLSFDQDKYKYQSSIEQFGLQKKEFRQINQKSIQEYMPNRQIPRCQSPKFKFRARNQISKKVQSSADITGPIGINSTLKPQKNMNVKGMMPNKKVPRIQQNFGIQKGRHTTSLNTSAHSSHLVTSPVDSPRVSNAALQPQIQSNNYNINQFSYAPQNFGRLGSKFMGSSPKEIFNNKLKIKSQMKNNFGELRKLQNSGIDMKKRIYNNFVKNSKIQNKKLISPIIYGPDLTYQDKEKLLLISNALSNKLENKEIPTKLDEREKAKVSIYVNTAIPNTSRGTNIELQSPNSLCRIQAPSNLQSSRQTPKSRAGLKLPVLASQYQNNNGSNNSSQANLKANMDYLHSGCYGLKKQNYKSHQNSRRNLDEMTLKSQQILSFRKYQL